MIAAQVDKLLSVMSDDDRYLMLRALSTTQNYAGEALSMLRLQPYQCDVVRTEGTRAIVRGGTRSGKSLVGYAIVASTFTGLPLLDWEGRPLPRFIDHDGPHLIWTIGLGEDHIGQTIHRYLFRAGAFKIIADKETGVMRAYRPWDPADQARYRETKPAPPLISARFMVGGEPVYENRGKHIFNHAEGKDGTFLYAYTSKGDVKMGDPVTLVHVDEDIKFNHYIPEWLSRLEDPWSKFLWTAFPWTHSTGLRLMSRRAEEEASLVKQGKRTRAEVCLYKLDTTKNQHITEVVQQRREADFLAFSPEEYAARVKGDFNDHLVEMYPNFSPEIHGCPAVIEEGDDAVDRAVRECEAKGGFIPEDWSLDVIVDPGHTHPGLLIGATPPPELGEVGIIVAEFYQPNTGAYEMALALMNLLKRFGRTPERTLIDSHAARQSYMGMSGHKVDLHYMQELSKVGYRAVQTGQAFQYASDNLEADLMEVRRWLSPSGNKGRPKLRYLRKHCPVFARQMENYRKHVTKEISTDKPAGGQVDPLCDCVRYWVSSRPAYHRPTKNDPKRAARLKLLRDEGIYGDDEDDMASITCSAPSMGRRTA